MLAGLRASEKGEEDYAKTMMRLSVAALTADLADDEHAASPSPIRRLSAAMKLSLDRSLALASAARNRALRLSQACAHLSAVETSTESEVRDALRSLERARTALARQHASMRSAFDELHRAFDKVWQRRALSSQAACLGGGGMDLWCMDGRAPLSACGRFPGQRGRGAGQGGGREARDAAHGGGAAADVRERRARNGTATTCSRRVALARMMAPPPLPGRSTWRTQMWPYTAAPMPPLPSNPFTRRSGMCTLVYTRLHKSR